MDHKEFKVLFVFVNERMRTLIPLNISYLSAALKQAGFSTVVFDTSFYAAQGLLDEEKKKEEAGIFEAVDYASIGVQIIERDLFQDLLEQVASEQPQLIAFSVFSQSRKINYSLARALRETFPQIPTLFGGVHVNIEPKQVLAQEFVDYICLGEGEEAIVELASALARGADPALVQNIGLKVDGQQQINPVRPSLPLDSLPFPDWNLFKRYHLYGPFRGRLLRMGLVEYSRTCPFNCGYCGNDIMRKTYRDSGQALGYRYKSPRHWVAELRRMMTEYDLEFLNIVDGTFADQSLANLEELAPLYQEEIGLPFFCCATVYGFSARKAQLLKKMGCVCVNVGIESGSDRYRREYMNRKMSNKQIIETFYHGRAAGLEMRSYNIIGMPFETREDIFETIELNREAKIGSLSLAIFMPYEGTVLRQLCIEQQLIAPDVEVPGDGTVPIIKNPNLCDAELVGLYNTFPLYVHAPKSWYPQIREAEADTPEGRGLRKKLLQTLQKG